MEEAGIYGRPMGKWNLWAHREKLIKGVWKVTGIIWGPSHIAFPCLYLIGISENSFPVAVLLTDKQPSVSARCRHSVCTYFLVELEYRNAITNENSDFYSSTNWLIFSKSLNPCFLIRTPRHLDYMGCKIPSASSDSLNVWFWVNLVTEMSSDLWSFMSSNP